MTIKIMLESNCIDGSFCDTSPGTGTVDRNDDGGPDAIDSPAAEARADRVSDQIMDEGEIAGGVYDDYAPSATPDDLTGDFSTSHYSPFDSWQWSIGEIVTCGLVGRGITLGVRLGMTMTGPVGAILSNPLSTGAGFIGAAACAVIVEQFEDMARDAEADLQHRLGGVTERAKPLVFSFDDARVELTGAYDQNVVWNVDGVNVRTGWVGRTEGILVLDFDQDGPDKANEIMLTEARQDGLTDLGALARGDINANGFFDPQDPAWQYARIWQDIDGSGRLSSGDTYHNLWSWHIDKIPLRYDQGITSDAANGNIVYGVTTWFNDGQNIAMADVGLGIAGRSAYRDLVLPINDTHIGSAGVDTLSGGIGNDTLLGGGSGDFLYGGNGTDMLRGHEGGDRFVGGAGSDTYVGGGGTDIFVPNGGTDIIWDFEKGADNLDLRAYGFASLAAVRAVATNTADGLLVNMAGPNAVIIHNLDSPADLLATDIWL